MPEESKKHQNKGPKDQRKSRNRHQAGSAEKKVEKAEEKVPAPPKPVYEEPGPEFYKNLKRETDDILKITEEANSKYKKKEIQSNWSKYEMPIESYDEIEEQENMGADYEKLIEATLSVGGHFQFKHEKSWDTETGPRLYDKYFEVNMDNLFLSLATIPFHERINVDKSIFSETDMLNMNSRSTRFKQKYYNDKTFTTPELTSQDNILRSLKEDIGKVNECMSDDEEDIEEKQEQMIKENIMIKNTQDIAINEIKLRKDNNESETVAMGSDDPSINVEVKASNTSVSPQIKMDSKDLENFEEIISDNKDKKESPVLEAKATMVPDTKDVEDIHDGRKQPKPEKNPVIESPEDLEKWLDDFLDDNNTDTKYVDMWSVN